MLLLRPRDNDEIENVITSSAIDIQYPSALSINSSSDKGEHHD
jgi:hypothetical protein